MRKPIHHRRRVKTRAASTAFNVRGSIFPGFVWSIEASKGRGRPLRIDCAVNATIEAIRSSTTDGVGRESAWIEPTFAFGSNFHTRTWHVPHSR
jgi:hypothetical protein